MKKLGILIAIIITIVGGVYIVHLYRENNANYYVMEENANTECVKFYADEDLPKKDKKYKTKELCRKSYEYVAIMGSGQFYLSDDGKKPHCDLLKDAMKEERPYIHKLYDDKKSCEDSLEFVELQVKLDQEQ